MVSPIQNNKLLKANLYNIGQKWKIPIDYFLDRKNSFNNNKLCFTSNKFFNVPLFHYWVGIYMATKK